MQIFCLTHIHSLSLLVPHSLHSPRTTSLFLSPTPLPLYSPHTPSSAHSLLSPSQSCCSPSPPFPTPSPLLYSPHTPSLPVLNPHSYFPPPTPLFSPSPFTFPPILNKTWLHSPTPHPLFQVSRKHLKLTPAQLSELGGHNTALPSGPDGERITKRAWEKTPFTPNTFKHQYAAQQKALSSQQKQLKEQQRLIADLQYLQRQQLLQQQAVQQQLVQQRVAMATDGGVAMTTPSPPLQKHLSRLQAEVTGRETGDVKDLEGIAGSEASVARWCVLMMCKIKP